jgi:hypothetical protein
MQFSPRWGWRAAPVVASSLGETVDRKSALFRVVAVVAIFGVPALLFVGVVYGFLSPREWGGGMLSWFAALLLATTVGKLTAKKSPASSGVPAVALDDHSRKRILREIWVRKAWIGILAVSLLIGGANGAAHRAWLPTLIGVGMALLWMYVTAREIRRRRERIDLTRQ